MILSVFLTIQSNGNWLLNLDGINYHLDRYYRDGQLYILTYGGDECFWTYEQDNKIIQELCETQ